MEGNSLDDILNEQAPETVETPEAEPVAQPEEPQVAEPEEKAPVRDDKGRFAPKAGETEGLSPEPKDEPKLDHPALLGERRRRQEAEDRIKAMEQQMRGTKPSSPQPWQQQQPQQPAKGFEFNEDLYWNNPQQLFGQFADHIRSQVLAEVQGFVPQAVSSWSIDRSEQAARGRYKDYDDAIAVFHDAATVNPDLRGKLNTESDPAEFAYREGKRLLEIANYGSLNEYIEAEVARRSAPPAPPKPPIPETLADARASRAPAGGVPMAPPSLDDILKG